MNVWKSECGAMELRLGDYREVLCDVTAVDCVLTDPPFSAKTHAGHDAGAGIANKMNRPTSGPAEGFGARSELSYASWSHTEIARLAAFFSTRCAGWMVALSDSILCADYRAQFELVGLTGFHPLPCVIPGMTVRMAGDGPSSWAVYANVARPKALHKWGTLPGAYICKPGERGYIGGKPLELMRALVRDYSQPDDLVCDPCAGSGTTLLAAAQLGRRAIGAEVDGDAFDRAILRLSQPYTVDLFVPRETRSPEQLGLDLFADESMGEV